MVKTKSSKRQSRKKPHIPREQRADLLFPIGRIARYFRQGHYAPRYSEKAAITMAAVLEYITEELLIICHDVIRKGKAVRIQPRHIREAIRDDEEFQNFLEEQLHVVINTFGNKKKKKKNDDEQATQVKQIILY